MYLDKYHSEMSVSLYINSVRRKSFRHVLKLMFRGVVDLDLDIFLSNVNGILAQRFHFKKWYLCHKCIYFSV